MKSSHEYVQGGIKQDGQSILPTITRVVRKVLRLCLYLKVICMLYNTIHTDVQINDLCGTVEKKNRVEK